jgi:hypothetical protein
VHTFVRTDMHFSYGREERQATMVGLTRGEITGFKTSCDTRALPFTKVSVPINISIIGTRR